MGNCSSPNAEHWQHIRHCLVVPLYLRVNCRAGTVTDALLCPQHRVRYRAGAHHTCLQGELEDQVRLMPESCLGPHHAGKPSPARGFPVVLKLVLGQEISACKSPIPSCPMHRARLPEEALSVGLLQKMHSPREVRFRGKAAHVAMGGLI